MDISNILRHQAYVDGKWVPASDGKTFDVRNPYDKSLLAKVASLGTEDAQKAIGAAHRAFKTWRKLTADERSKILKKWYILQIEHLEELAYLLTLEQGKPIAEAKGEIKYGASFVEWFAEEAPRVYGDTIPAHQKDLRIMTLKEPVGVVAAITPWNFPSAMITRKVAPALAAGCTVVLKPSELTPLSALALAVLAEKAGFPAGVFNVVTSFEARPIGELFTNHPLIRKISFTGSTATGKWLMKQSVDTVKKLSMELGGNAPFIVFDDADVQEAVKGLISSKFRNAGQTCVCANRVFIQERVYEEFSHKLIAAVKKLKHGSGLEAEVEIGPLINERALENNKSLIDDALGKGAQILIGGKALGGTFFEPTVITNIEPSMRLYSEEIFGPIAPLIKFQTEDQAIQFANDTRAGLASYFYGRDYARILRVAEALEYGMVGVNTGMISTAVAPFGGVKESGIGREGSKYGINDYLEIKYICLGGVNTI